MNSCKLIEPKIGEGLAFMCINNPEVVCEHYTQNLHKSECSFKVSSINGGYSLCFNHTAQLGAAEDFQIIKKMEEL